MGIHTWFLAFLFAHVFRLDRDLISLEIGAS